MTSLGKQKTVNAQYLVEEYSSFPNSFLENSLTFSDLLMLLMDTPSVLTEKLMQDAFNLLDTVS